ncbi:MAG: phosphohistidine phosphatase SixA [Candidatus Aminicenantaceae bacterium]
MKLYLVRHAQAKSKQEDPERSLSEQGLSEINKVASFLSAQSMIQVSHVFHSGKNRARQTAEVLSEHLTFADNIKKESSLEPLENPGKWANRLVDEKENIMLVGHLPHLNKLCALLLSGDEEHKIVDLPGAGIICLQRDDSNSWIIHWMVTPEIAP